MPGHIERAGISPTMLDQAERGSCAMTVDTLVALCHALDTHPDFLLSFSIGQRNLPLPEPSAIKEHQLLTELVFQSYALLKSAAEKQHTKTP